MLPASRASLLAGRRDSHDKGKRKKIGHPISLTNCGRKWANRFLSRNEEGMKKKRWIGFLPSHPTLAKWAVWETFFNKTPGHLPKETFPQSGGWGLGVLFQCQERVTVCWNQLHWSPISAISEREVTLPQVTRLAQCHISVSVEWDQEASGHLGQRAKPARLQPGPLRGRTLGNGLPFEALKFKKGFYF